MRTIPLLLTLPALALAACTSTMPDVGTVVTGRVELQVTAGVSTRSTDVGWDADVIGIRTVSVSEGSSSTMTRDYANVPYATDKIGSGGASFKAVNAPDKIFFDDRDATAVFTAYGPYTEADDGLVSSLPGADGVIAVDTRHQHTEGDYLPGDDPAQEAINYIWAPAVSASKSNPDVNFVFTHCMAELKLVIYPGAGTDVEEEEHLPYYLHGLIHDGTFDVTTGKAVATGEPEDTEIFYNFPFEVDKDEDDEHKDVVYTILVLPQQIESLSISTDVNGENLVGEFKLPTYTDPDTGEQVTGFEAGKSYTYTTYVRPRELQTERGSLIADWIDPDTGEAAEAYNDNLWNGHKIGIAVVNYQLDENEADTDAADQLYTSFRNVAYYTESEEEYANFHVCDYLDAIWYRNEGDELSMSAYSPYQESGDKSLLPGDDGKVTVDCAELSAAYGSEATNFIFAGETSSVYDSENHTHFVDFDFTHSMAKIVITFIRQGTAFKGFYVNGLATTGVFDVTTGEAHATGEAARWTFEDVNLNYYVDHTDVDENSSNDFTFYIFPQTAMIQFEYSSSGRNTSTSFAPSTPTLEQTYEAGHVYHYTVTGLGGIITSGETYPTE